MSKGAVVNMTRVMAAHRAMAKTRVNCVCPALRIPEMLSSPIMYLSGKMNPAMREAQRKRSLLQASSPAYSRRRATREIAPGL
ncbi:hypothetical protein N7510_009744 [Penicillium lagena]|uniref:uncharacterized protein n=1 Tax=Penicillium lagena TaxID=94218 RepID=UPI00253FD56E|nr:uncharacterized protein N7510_009744 [Penicillium lagena]KAJ5604590.1 hypothetical protein N7510_009744 [Penicillium lagena]